MGELAQLAHYYFDADSEYKTVVSRPIQITLMSPYSADYR